MTLPFALIADGPPRDRVQRWLRFGAPSRVLLAGALEEVVPQLHEVERAVERGSWAVGFLTYEAAPAFDPVLATQAPTPGWPLAYWALCEPPEALEAPPGRLPAGVAADATGSPALDWRPLLGRKAYARAIAAIRRAIAAGDTYQVNFTFPLEAPCTGDAFALFAALVAAQRAPHAAWLDLGERAVVSASPELFVARDGELVRTRPMKGTGRRAPDAAGDQVARDHLLSPKNRAENLMIVDMMRNDLGKVAAAGSVRVTELFAAETYPTVHQLVSEVQARTAVSNVDLLRALFPCASITGAPKQRTMGLIRLLERRPRGLYTGALGYWAPGRKLALSVAIRTVLVDRAARVARYGVGGGVVWDSRADAEYRECQAKALVLTAPRPSFRLLETMLWRRRSGIFLRSRHLARLAASAGYFDFAPPSDDLGAALDLEAQRRADALGADRLRLRLLWAEEGEWQLEAVPLPCTGRAELRLALDDRPIDAADPFLHHKTTHRVVYEQAAARHPGAGEVLMWNERGELTEATRANLVLQQGGALWTPPVACGLLAGTYRAELLERGRLRERVLHRDELERADAIFLINSVQGWRRGRLGAEPMPGESK